MNELSLLRWSVSTGSAARSRATVMLELGGHARQAVATGDGPVDALLSAVDAALRVIIGGHTRLLAYDVRALADGADAPGQAAVRLAPPPGLPDDRSAGEFAGRASSTDILEASLGAYLAALRQMLAAPAWKDAIAAPEAAPSGPMTPRAQTDPDAAEHDMTRWYHG